MSIVYLVFTKVRQLIHQLENEYDETSSLECGKRSRFMRETLFGQADVHYEPLSDHKTIHVQ